MWQKLSAQAPPFVPQQRPKPLCLSNASYANAIEQFSEQLPAANETASLTALLIGSGHRKLNPPDVDLLVLSAENVSETLQYIETHATFFNSLVKQAESDYLRFYQHYLSPNSITRVIAALCRNGATITKAYTKERRSIITLHLFDSIDIDINLQNNTLEKHAEKSDFSINTLYFDLKKYAYVYTHKHAIEDIATKTLRAAGNDANILFKNDITTLFRALRIIAEENYTPEAELLAAMTMLPVNLPEALTTLNRSKFALGKKRIFCAGHAVNALNFLEESHLFDYLFPDIRSLDQKSEKQTMLLFRKIAEASDAYFNKLDQAPNYPHAISAYIKKHCISPADSQNIMLCLFDYAIYGISSNDQTMLIGKFSFFNTEIYDAACPVAFNTLFEHILCLDDAFKEFIHPERSSPCLDSEHGNSADYTSQESLSESSEPQSNMLDSDSEEETRTKISPTTLPHEKEEQPKHEHQEIVTTPENIKTEKKNKKKRGSNKNKNKNKPPPLTQEEKRIYDMYSHGADYLAIHEHENALYCLTQAAENETCKQELKLKIDNIMSTTKVENPETPSKIFLSIAVLFDSIGEHDEAVKYYQQFLLKQAIKNVGLDKDEPKESLYHFSFVYLRLMILFKELSRNTKKKEYYQMISEKYRNEIILSPIISKSIKNQEEEYTEKLSEEPPCNPIKRTSKENRAPVTIPGPNEWLEEANRSFDRGLYYSSKSYYYKTLKRVTDLNSTLFLIKQIMICYIQLEMYEQSIFFLEKEDRQYDFIVAENNAQIIDRISLALSAQSWKSENIDTFCNAITLLEKIMHLTGNSDKVIEFFKENLNIVSTPQFNLTPHTEEKKSLLCFKIAASYSDTLLKLIKKDRANTQISVLFLEMTSHYNRYQNGPKMAVIPTEEENKVSQRISNIQFILNLPQKIPTTSTFFQPNDASISTATGIPSQIKT